MMEPTINVSGKTLLKVEDNLLFLKNFFGTGFDLVESRYEALENHVPVGLAYIDSMADSQIIMEHLVMPLLQSCNKTCQGTENIIGLFKSRIITATDIRQTSDMSKVIDQILKGNTILFAENANAALIIATRKVEKRSVEAPENESTVFGSQESFTDDLKTNCSLILKRLPVPGLRFEEFTVGTLSQTKVKLIWLDGIANSKVINTARSRIQNIDTDNVDGLGVLGELIEDNPLSLFSKFRQTERPDVAARNLTGGRFVIICSNSPFAIVAPVSFWDNFKSMDDYEERSPVSSYLRIVRYLAFAFSMLISSIYLSFVTYNQAIVPSKLALSIASGREGVPFPSVVELLLLTFFITVIREAGLRMPGSVGFFVATLAATVIGQAVVAAGYASPSLIIVVAISTISSFAVSTTSLVYPSNLLNYIFILLAGCFGIFGVSCGLTFLLWYLITLESFGMPYLYPILPFDGSGAADTITRPLLGTLTKRMKFLSPINRVRTGNNTNSK